jgi:hypothetical protein
MPNRTRRTTSRRPATVSHRAVGPLEKVIKDEVSARMRPRLGLHEREPIPEPIQSLVDAAARDVAENAVEIAVIHEVEETARNLARVSSAWPTSDVRTVSFDLDLLQDAEKLAAKSKALQGAGFTREEALRLLVAEISAGGSIFSSA